MTRCVISYSVAFRYVDTFKAKLAKLAEFQVVIDNQHDHADQEQTVFVLRVPNHQYVVYLDGYLDGLVDSTMCCVM